MSDFEYEVRGKLAQVLAGADLSSVLGSTTVRGALGLILDNLALATEASEEWIWYQLQPENKKLVHRLRDEFWDEIAAWKAKR